MSFLNFFGSNNSSTTSSTTSSTSNTPTNGGTSMNTKTSSSKVTKLGESRPLSQSTDGFFNFTTRSSTPSMDIPNQQNRETSYYRMLQVVEAESSRFIEGDIPNPRNNDKLNENQNNRKKKSSSNQQQEKLEKQEKQPKQSQQQQKQLKSNHIGYAFKTRQLSSDGILFEVAIENEIDKRYGIEDEEELKKIIIRFCNELAVSSPKSLTTLLESPRNTSKKLLPFLCDFIVHDKERNSSDVDNIGIDRLKLLADLKHPHNWFPLARSIKRKIILHVGPTNSGKTHNALNRLFSSSTGIYCGPLRLLAGEIHSRALSNGVKCNLLTGQLKYIDPDSTHTSCTVELAPRNKIVDCAVIDEFQMISDLQRGSAFTKAILGIPALEIHLCGDNTAVNFIKNLATLTGDTVEINNYERLVPLKVLPESIAIRDLRPGDAVICFSKRSIFEMKQKIEKKTKLRCAIVYGGLPPLVRTEQAESFNTSAYDVIVASDAIGMGLNLKIQRVVFESTSKFDGDSKRQLKPTELKQIGGRAGRYSSGFPYGEVTCLNRHELPIIRHGISASNVSTERAGIFPEADQLIEFSKAKDNRELSFHKLLLNFFDHTNLDHSFFLEDQEDRLTAAKLIDDIDLSIQDKWTFMNASLNVHNTECCKKFKEYATHFYEANRISHLVDIPPKPKGKHNRQEYLAKLETAYNQLDMYFYFHFHFPEIFYDKSGVESSIADINSEILNTLISLGKKPRRSKGKEINDQDDDLDDLGDLEIVQ
eukprot:gene6071-7563_t